MDGAAGPGGSCLVGETCPLEGSMLENDVGLE